LPTVLQGLPLLRIKFDKMSGDIDVNERLREQCSVGDEDDVMRHLRNGAAVNSQNRVNGWSALHFAARREHAGIVRVLLEHGADTSIKNNKGEVAIDMTSNKEIRRIVESYQVRNEESQKEDSRGANTCDSETNQNGGTGEDRPLSTVGFLPGYLANPVFPYTFAAPKVTANESDAASSSDNSDQHVLVPGYLANPVYAVAARGPILASGRTPSSETLQNDGTVNFVPGYIANPVIPYAVAASQAQESNEIKQIFVPHVEQFGSLVNTYVNSMKSLEKPVEYHMCDSCKTTPVATVYVGSNISELVIKVRKAYTNDPDFIEVELNRKILTYDELINVCSKELKVDRDSITKIRKLPNSVVRRDKDVQRLQPFQELEVVLLNS